MAGSIAIVAIVAAVGCLLGIVVRYAFRDAAGGRWIRLLHLLFFLPVVVPILAFGNERLILTLIASAFFSILVLFQMAERWRIKRSSA